MPVEGFEPTIPMFKRPKNDHVLDRAATVIGVSINTRDQALSERDNMKLCNRNCDKACADLN
jgi:hypothetical protein